MQVQLRVGEADPEGRRRFSLHSRREEAGLAAEWTRNAAGTLAPATALAVPTAGAEVPAGAEPLAVELLYEQLADAGIEYGPAFQGLRTAWREGGEIFAEVEVEDLVALADNGVEPEDVRAFLDLRADDDEEDE